MTAKTKLAQKRLTLLQLAEKLGNVSKACRMHRVSRSQFYEYKRSFQTHGFDDLIDKPPIQQLLGHSDVRTTLIYTHTVKSTTQKEAKSPLDFKLD